MSEGFNAFEADIVWRANTGQVEGDIEGLRRVANEAYGGMSADSLRLANAQDRLDRALAKPNRTASQARSAYAAYRREVDAVTRASEKESVALNQTEHELGQVTRGALTGTGAMHGLGRSVAFASGSFLGSAGLVFGIRESVKQAVAQDRIIANLRNSLAAGGHSWDDYGARIEAATSKLKVQSAFDDEELYQSLQLLVRGTGNVGRALELNGLAADVARGRNMGLVQAATLLVRVQAGQTGSLRRLGIQVDKGITGTKALEQVQRQYAGAAQTYANSAAGAQDLLTIAIQDTEKAVGRGLLPAIQDLDRAIVPWLANTDNQKKIQEDVNQAADDGAKIVRGLAGAVHTLSPEIKLVVSALGGLEHAVETALILGLVLKARKAAAAFGLIQLASNRARTAVVADAVAEEGALNSTAVMAERVAARVGNARGRLLRGAAGAAALSLVLPEIIGDKGTAGDAETSAINALIVKSFTGSPVIAAATITRPIPKGSVLASLLRAHGVDRTDPAAVSAFLSSRGIGNSDSSHSTIDVAALFAAISRGEVNSVGVRSLKGGLSDADYEALLQHAQQQGAGLAGESKAGKPGAFPLTASQLRAQALSNAGLDPNSPQAVAAYRDQAAADRRALEFLEKRRADGKIKNKKYLQEYRALTSDLASQEGSIASAAASAAELTRKTASKSDAAGKKAQREYETTLRARALELQNAVTEQGRTTAATGTTPLLGRTATRSPAEAKLLDFYKAEAKDARLSREERARYRQLILNEQTKEKSDAEKLKAKQDKLRAGYLKVIAGVGTLGLSAKDIRELDAKQVSRNQEIEEATIQLKLAQVGLITDPARRDAVTKKLLREDAAFYHRLAAKETDRLKQIDDLRRETDDRIQLASVIGSGKTDFGALRDSFLADQQRIIGAYAPNANAVSAARRGFAGAHAGKTDTRLHELVHESRQTNAHLADIRAGTKFPASKFSQLDRDAAYGG